MFSLSTSMIYLSALGVGILTLLSRLNFSSKPLQGLVWHPTAQQIWPCQRIYPQQRGQVNNSDLLCLFLGPKWSSPRLCATPARRGRVNLAIPPTISFSLHIHYSSQLGMSHSSGPYVGPYALNYIPVALKIHGSLNLPGEYFSFTATSELLIYPADEETKFWGDKRIFVLPWKW